MPETADALVKRIHVEGTTPEYVDFVVEAPPDLPETFREYLDHNELDRLKRLTDSSAVDDVYDIGRVPVRYDGGWEIAWDKLED